MPISVSCPGCGRKGKVPDGAAGKRAQCPACGANMEVPAAKAIPPAQPDDRHPPRRPAAAASPPPPPSASRAREAAPSATWDDFLAKEEAGSSSARGHREGRDELLFDEDDEAPPLPRRKGPPADHEQDLVAARPDSSEREGNPLREFLAPIVVGIGAILLVALIFKGLHSQEAREVAPPTQAVAFATSAANAGVPNGIAAAPAIPAPLAPVPAAGFPPDANGGFGFRQAQPIPPRADLPRPAPPAGTAAPASAPAGVGFGGEAADKGPNGIWGLHVDPPAQPVEFAKGNALRIPIPSALGQGNVVFPSTYSPVVAVGKNTFDNDFRDVWDLKANRRIGRIGGKLEINDCCALSPDGKLFAAVAPHRKRIWVWTTEDARGRVEIPFDREPEFIDFAAGDRLVAVDNWEHRAMVYSLKDGSRVLEFPIPDGTNRESFAVSPGRRYFVAAGKGRLQAYDMESGANAADVVIEKSGSFDPDCKGLAFSADGEELAGLFTEAFQPATVRAWEVATGSESARLTIPEKDLGRPATWDRNSKLQFLPERAGFLVYGQGVFERKSGQRIWLLPFENGRYPEGPRVVIDLGRVLTVVGDRPGLLSVVPLPKEKLNAAIETVREGGNALDAMLPKLAKPDLSGAKRVGSPGAVAWRDVRDPAPEARVGRRPISIAANVKDVERILFAAPESGRAIVASFPDAGPGASEDAKSASPRRVERFDLAAGRRLGAFDTLPGTEPIAVGTDGELTAVRALKDKKRFDILDAKGSHVAGWRPYSDGEGEAQEVAWAAFLDPKSLLTVSTSGALVLWSLPGVRAEYVADAAVIGEPILSPGRKYLASIEGGELRILEARTGAMVASRPVPEAARQNVPPGFPNPRRISAAFRRDGGELAVVAEQVVTRIDSATGRAIATDRVDGCTGSDVAYCGEGYLLLDHRLLFDLGRKVVVWNYAGQAVHGAGAPDGDQWLVVGFPLKPGVLGSLRIPEPKALAAMELGFNPATPGILKRGDALSLVVEGANPTKDPAAYRQQLIEGMTASLRNAGYQVADGQPRRLVVRIRDEATGETIHVREFGRFNLSESFPERRLTVEVVLETPDAKPLTLFAMPYGMQRFGMVFTEERISVEEHFRRGQWEGAKSWLTGFSPPFFVGQSKGELVMLPGTTNWGNLAP